MLSTKDQNKLDQTVQDVTRKIKRFSIITGIILAVVLAVWVFMRISIWFDNNRIVFQTPVIIQAPILIKRRVVPTPTPKVAPKPKIKSNLGVVETVEAKEIDESLLDKVYDYIWLRESGRGTNKTGLNGFCISNGQINEIGYAPHDNFCFSNQTEQKATVKLWFRNRLAGIKTGCITVESCLSLYSGGAYKSL